MVAAGLVASLIFGFYQSVGAQTGGTGTPKKAGNNVNVFSCTQTGNDIQVTYKKSWATTTLKAGCRNAGYGFRDYSFSCISNKVYRVEWENCVSPTAQASLASLTVINASTSAKLGAAANSSYQTLNKKYAAKQLLTVQPSVNALQLSVQTKNVTNTQYTYAFGWADSTTGQVNFNEALAKSIATNAQFDSSTSVNFPVTDFYRNRHVTVLAFMRNNDGVSRVPNMPVEVDDIIAVHLRILPKPQPQPPVVISCDNLNGGDGAFTLCFGRTFTHTSGGVITYAANYGNNVGLSFNGAGSQFLLGTGQSLSFLAPDQKTIVTTRVENVDKNVGTVKLKVVSQLAPNAPVAATNTMAISLAELQNLQPQTLTFEDNSGDLATKYMADWGVAFTSKNGKAIFVNAANRGNTPTASGDIAIANDAMFPLTSANDPLVIDLTKGAKAVGFYLGNGNKNNEQVTATITLYGKDGVWLGTFTRNPGNPVTSFFGARSSASIYRVTIDYGSSYLSEVIDSLMFVPV